MQNRSEAQVEASRRNGALSRGPVTAAGKLRSSSNAIQHGMTAVIHSPPGQPAHLVLDMEQAVTTQVRPRGPAEEEIVRQLALDLVRLQRIERAHDAVAERAAVDVEKDPERSDELFEVAKGLAHWKIVRGRLEGVVQAPEDERDGYMPFMRKVIVHASKSGVRVDPLDALGQKFIDLTLKYASGYFAPGQELALMIEMADTGIAYFEGRRARLHAEHDARVAADLELAQIPDERMSKRLDRYRAATERSVQRKIGILRELRHLDRDSMVGFVS